MTILEALPHLCQALIRTRTRGPLGGSRDTFTQIFANRECWRQFSKATPIEQYQKRGFSVVDKFYFTIDPQIDERHILIIDDEVWEVLSRAEPDATAGLGVVYKVMAGLWTTSSTLAQTAVVIVTPTPEPAAVEDDDMLDFEDIGGVYDNQALALANRNALLSYIGTRAASAKDVALKFTGPVNTTLNNKREPGTAYIDLSGGTVEIEVGAAAKVQNLLFHGLGTIAGVNANAVTTPIFKITRSAGTTPDITLRDLRLTNPNGSGLYLLQPGATTRAENLHVDYGSSMTYAASSLDYEGWTDLNSAPFGIYIEEGDGGFIMRAAISSGKGHGLIAKRWHAGRFEGNIREQQGSGMKVQQVAMSRFNLRAESNEGYGLHARNCGADLYAGGSKLTPEGSTNNWLCWLEANNGRATPYTSSGYSFSQFKLEDCARLKLHGHSGWRNNQARLDLLARQRNLLVEEQYTSVSGTADFELVTGNTVDVDIDLPADGFGSASKTNWDVVWTDASYRPTATLVGTSGVDERVRITWPADSFNNTAITNAVAYWRPWGGSALSSPAAFYWEAEVEDVDGNIASYCASRESASNRQTAIIGGFVVEPVSLGLMTFPLWDQNNRKFSGSGTVDDTRSDISPGFNAWILGMQDQEGNAPQSNELIMDIHQLRMWRFV